jgi:hypothetical protein
MFPDESTVILRVILRPVVTSAVNAVSVPDELYFKTNIEPPVFAAGNVYPELRSELFRSILFMVTVPVEEYSPVTYMFPDESVVILYPMSEPVPLSAVNATSVPLESYFTMNISLLVVAGNVYPELTSELFKAILFMVTVPDEVYCPVTYMFPDESVVILYPMSEPVPLSAVNATSVPDELYFRMNISLLVAAGNVYPELTSELFKAILFMVTVPDEVYCPVTYMFPDESVVIPYPMSEPVPFSAVNAMSVPDELYFRMNISMPVVAGNVYPELTSELFKAILFTVTVPDEVYCPVTYMFPDESVVIPYPASEPVPFSAVNATSVPDELYFRMNISLPLVAGNVYPELTSELFRAKLFIDTAPVDV